jgi:anti-sigma regulatory factor (Ser/Thr protein kinase)
MDQPWRAAIELGGAVALVTASAYAEASHGSLTSQVVLVPVVGGVFLAAARPLAGSSLGRHTALLSAVVGVTWLLPSFVSGILLWHQGALLVLCGGVIGLSRVTWPAVLVLGSVIAAGLATQGWSALAFVALAAAAAVGPRRLAGRRLLGAVSAGLVGLTLLALWWWGRSAAYDPVLAVIAYELTLLTVAAVLVAGAHMIDGRSSRLQNLLVAHPPPDGLAGLETVLGEILGDPSLRLLPAGSPGVPVRDEDDVVAVVSSARMTDPVIADAVLRSVRLVAHWQRVRAEHDRARASLLAARQRTATSVEAERRSMARRLEVEVLPLARRATDDLRRVVAVLEPGTDASGAASLALEQLVAATTTVVDTVGGRTDVQQRGPLVDALRSLARRSAVPCRFETDLGEPDVDPTIVEALFYACSEGLANAHKHAAATLIVVGLHRVDGHLVLRIGDNGVGGADPTGPGLQGLAHRLSVLGGSAEIWSEPGRGTELVVRLPDQRVDAIRFQARMPR